jgi:uncharacterized membrane protein YphA (DoxX/SURF4 family)
MKATKITYWVSTAIISLGSIFAAYAYLTQDTMLQAFHHLGFPDYFRYELAAAKLLGAILLLAPVWARVKEWTYAAFGIVYISAITAHTASGDPIGIRAAPAIFLLILIISYVSYTKINTEDITQK